HPGQTGRPAVGLLRDRRPAVCAQLCGSAGPAHGAPTGDARPDGGGFPGVGAAADARAAWGLERCRPEGVEPATAAGAAEWAGVVRETQQRAGAGGAGVVAVAAGAGGVWAEPG